MSDIVGRVQAAMQDRGCYLTGFPPAGGVGFTSEYGFYACALARGLMTPAEFEALATIRHRTWFLSNVD